MTTIEPKPYNIGISDELLQWINDRVRTARIPQGKDLPTDQASTFGLPVDIALKIHKHWTTNYDWRAVEKQLSEELRQFTLPIKHNDEELTIHFVHHRSKRPNAIPLLFAHGWPGSFLEVRPIINLLTDPEDPDAQAYHVVAPSLPGFGFSSFSSKPFSPTDHAKVLHQVMIQLGYNTFMVQGGDWGSMIVRLIALDYPESCPAVHVNMTVAVPPSALWNPLQLGRVVFAFTTGWFQSAYEAKIIERMKWWQRDESGYLAIQSTKPLTIQYSLADSPFGFMCWIRDKLEPLVDEGFVWSEEEAITMAMPYIINGTMGHAEIYRYSHGDLQKAFGAQLGRKLPKTSSFGASVFPKDALYSHRWWAETTVAHNITFWKQHDSGGHFASIEKPKELVEDIRGFTQSLDKQTLERLCKA